VKEFRAKVYISGPFTTGDTRNNVRRALLAADQLLERGFAPYVPHLNYFWNLAHHHPYEEWMRLDKEWIRTCDIVLRLSGESPGAEEELLVAAAHYVPVAYSMEEVERRFSNEPS